MKLNLKMIAVAAAMVATGSANATLTAANVPGGSSLVLVAFSTATQDYYYRDLGYTLNQFLPNAAVVAAGDGGVIGDKSPEAGLTIDKTTNASFADAAFGTWLSGETASNVRWLVTAGDSLTTGANGFSRLLQSVAGTAGPVGNGQVRAGAASVTGLPSAITLSGTGTSVPATFTQNNLLQVATLGTLDNASSLFYYTATTQTGSTAVTATANQFGNSAGFATITLASNGDLSYSLAPASVSAVPVPAAAWLFGSGLMSMVGVVRRRKAAAAV